MEYAERSKTKAEGEGLDGVLGTNPDFPWGSTILKSSRAAEYPQH